MIIGIAGKKESGKDTSAHILQNLFAQRGEDAEIRHFASPLKRICAEITDKVNKDDFTNIRESFFRTPFEKDRELTLREIYQIVGTDIFRAYNSNFWINMLFKKPLLKKHLIIADVRFDNEVAAICGRGGIILHLARGQSEDKHNSENGLANLPITYYNNGTIKELELFLKQWLQ